ncbi:MAG: M12 family metallopeptidase, partial [Bdellovibrionales bacterium]|nr:M12 family metallopeptidase [Bdellovibrionales bacterium]
MNNKINLLLKWPKVSLMLFWIFLLGCSPYAHRENSSSEENSDRLESLLLSVPARFFQDNEIYEKDLTFRDVGGYGFFEGDIVLGKTNKLTQTTLNFILPSSQTGMILPEDLDVIRPFGYASQGGRLWTGGIVPYEFSQEVERAEAAVKQAMDQITQMTGIRFVKRTSETDYLRFVKSDVAGTCGSYVGRLGGEQEIFIQSGAQGCGLSSNVHELLHALGIYHEQSRSDRDQYVEILYDNIEKGFARQFDIMPGITLGQYDFRSVMHYGTTFFSKNGKPTIRSLNGEKIERTSPMSATDAEAIRTLYSGEMSGSRQCDMGSAGGPCPVFNGTGRMENQTCDTSSLQWVGGVCTVQSCNSGFKPDAANMSCVADAVENQVPVGNVDDLSNTGLLQGWAYDPDQPGTSIAIHYYIDGGFAGNNVADKIRTDINDKLKIPGNHGFQFTIPSQYRDGKSHTIGAYAIDLQGGTNPLVGTRSFLLGNSAVGQCDPSTKGGACPIANGAGRMENQTCDTSSLQWVGGVCTVQSC